jgi:ribose transport system permease protein
MSEVAGDPIAGKSRETVTHAQRMRAMFQYAGMLPVLILLCIGFAIENGRFASLTNISIVLQQAAINTVLAAGMTFVILTAGIDLSVGSILAASAMGALLVSKIHGLGMLGIVAGLAVGLGFGLINGLLIALVRLPPFIVTLGSLTAVRGMARLMGSDTTIFNANLPFAFIGNGTLFGVSWLVIIALIVVVLSWFILRRTVLGTRIYAVGGNPDAARLTGSAASCPPHASMPRMGCSLGRATNWTPSPPSFWVAQASPVASDRSGAH